MGRRTTPGDPRGARRGYTLVALMIGLTVMMIMIAAVLPSVSAEMQRMREDELIFRGSQYAEGIRVFRRRYGRYPNTLKEMIETRPRSLRKLWKDPMTEDGQWGVIGMTAPIQGLKPPGGGSGAEGAKPTPTPTPGPFDQGGKDKWGTPGTGGQLGPVTGVYSKSTSKGFRQFQGRENYNDWQFTEQTVFGTTGAAGGGGPSGVGIGGGVGGSGGGTVPK